MEKVTDQKYFTKKTILIYKEYSFYTKAFAKPLNRHIYPNSFN